MNKILFLFLISICFFTTLICIKKPVMHNKILVYNSDYVIVEEKKPENKPQIIKKEIPTIKQETKTQKKQESITTEKKKEQILKQKENKII